MTRSSTRLRRTWPQRLLILFNVICIVSAVGAAGGLAYAKKKTGEVRRVVLGPEITAVEELEDDAPRNFLLVGVDSTEGLDDDDPAKRTDEGKRTDTIMILRVDPKTTEAKMLSLPRDLLVDIPGKGRDRINAAFNFGDERLLVQTIRENFGIDINHYVEVNFKAFKDMVSEVGGMPIYFATPVKDSHGFRADAGCIVLDADSALSYVRSRYYYVQDENGKWRQDPTSDKGRTLRQQDFVKRLLHRAFKNGARNPLKLNEFVNIAVDNLRLDERTSPGDLLALAKVFRNFDPDELKTYTIEYTDVKRGGAWVVEAIPSRTEPILQLFRGTGEQSGDLTPASVGVRVVNGSGRADLAADTTAVLKTAGFRTGRLDSMASGPAVTEVRYKAGQEAAAALVARHLATDPVYVEDPTADEIVVVTGADFDTALAVPRPDTEVTAPSTTLATTTTAAPTTTAVTTTTSVEATPTTGLDADGVMVTIPSDFVPRTPDGVSCG